jgi:hypothetical protein
MRIELYREDDPEHPVAGASWDGRTVGVDAGDDGDLRSKVQRMFRLTPVVVSDPAMLPQGSRGEVVVQPGTVGWFRAAAFARAGEVGLKVRVVPEVVGQGGWDPAASYRTFREQTDRVVASGYTSPAPQAGERPEAERAEPLGSPPASQPPARN